MKINKVWAVFFSPTGNTKTVAELVRNQLANDLSAQVDTYNFTMLEARNSFPQFDKDDIVVFATPTYAGRVPNVLLKYLNTIQGNGAFAIPMVTFGNRNFDNSLIELRDILEIDGFHTFAAAALAGEHAFSYTLGAGRPDEQDKGEILDFAKNVSEKIKSSLTDLSSTENSLLNLKSPIEVDGIPETYGGYYSPKDADGNHIDIRKVHSKANNNCIDCGICAEVCPMDSIDHIDVRIMTGICIKCGACIKDCPVGARYFDDEGYLYHTHDLERSYNRRAENKFFF
jgi:ferredoxin/flavodoxin